MAAKEAGEQSEPNSQMLIYEDGAQRLQVRLDGATLWLTQAQLAELYGSTKQNISVHIRNILDEEELREEGTVKSYLTVQVEGSRRVSRSVEHYSLDMILAIGYRVRSRQGTRFRQWATLRLSELLTKGFTLDDERIKSGRAIGRDYFDELLARIRDIRSSERLFHQKVIEIFALSIDYDRQSPIARTFFQTVQNKLHFAAHGHTAAEIIKDRADADATNMGLHTWKNAPVGPVRKPDVTIAKNYLNAAELTELNLLVSAFLDIAELQASRKASMRMADWATRMEDFLKLTGHGILQNAGTVSHELAAEHANRQFERYNHARLETQLEQTSEYEHLAEDVKELARTRRISPGSRHRK